MTTAPKNTTLPRAMRLENARVLDQKTYPGGQRELVLHEPAISSAIQPGQFVHLRVPNLASSVLRRPFSVFKIDTPRLSILYECVGVGTRAMTRLRPGETVSIMGPLGNGFPTESDKAYPVLIAGGYGVAPLHFLASRLDRKGTVFIGGADGDRVLCAEDFEHIGWRVIPATEDGSLGYSGLVTEALEEWLGEYQRSFETLEFFACGPDGMLRTVSQQAIFLKSKVWVSLDRHMGCGIGACLACVHKIRDGKGDIKWKRVCREGPVFEARQVVWE
ncbi:MAG: dihydroorotate dehydrogenase electron transfer subunit [Kiritimatiellia bacterium]